jgi:hypothetical protein
LFRPKRVWRRKYAALRVLLSSGHVELRDEIRRRLDFARHD